MHPGWESPWIPRAGAHSGIKRHEVFHLHSTSQRCNDPRFQRQRWNSVCIGRSYFFQGAACVKTWFCYIIGTRHTKKKALFWEYLAVCYFPQHHKQEKCTHVECQGEKTGTGVMNVWARQAQRQKPDQGKHRAFQGGESRVVLPSESNQSSPPGQLRLIHSRSWPISKRKLFRTHTGPESLTHSHGAIISRLPD